MNAFQNGGAFRIFAFALVLLAACNASPPSIDRLLAEARQYQQKGDLKAAVVVLKNILQQDPQQGEARYLMGLVFKQNGEPRGAEHHFREALKAKYRPEVVLPLLAQALFDQGQFDKVLEATRSSDYGDAALQPEILTLRGHSEISLGRPADAVQLFEEALKRKPEYVPALLGEVRLASIKGDVRATVALVDRALAADPSSLDAWLMKGDLERAAGKPDAALAAYQKALALKPRSLAANLNLASMYLTRGKLDLARKHVETVMQILPDSAVGYYLLGLLEYRSRNFTAANEAVQQVLKASPNYLPATALAGVVAYSVGANDQAEKHLSEALARAPRSVYLRTAYAAVLLKSGKAREAINVLEPALKSRPDDPAAIALFAEAKLQNNEIRVARKYFELAATQNPQSPRIRAGLGLARLAAGETERALADLEAAAELGGTAAELFLARNLLSVRQYDKALEVVLRLETKRPNDPITFNLKGAILFAKGDAPGARKAFERAAELQPAQFAAAVNLAQLDVREKNPVAARKRFEKILEGDKDNVPAMLAISDIEAAANNLDEAILWAERAMRVRPKAFAPSLALAKLYFVKGEFAKTITAARDALAANPNHSEALNILGYAQLRSGQTVAALDTYSTLANRYPNSAEAHYGLSNAQSANGRFEAAERSLKQALKLRPNFPEAMYALSALQLRAGRTAEASKLIGDAQKQLPKSALASVITGDAAMTQKRYEQAVRAYEAAFAMEKSRVVLEKLHGALRGAGRAATADALTADWLQKYPDDLQVRYVVANTAIQNQNFRLAAEQYEYALQKERDKLPLLHNLGWVYERMNDPRALEMAEAAYKIAPDRPGVVFNLGRLVLKKGDADRAVKLLEKARLLSPDSHLVRYDLAKAYVTTGANARARTELEQLLRGRQEFAERGEAEELLRKLKN